MTALNEALFFIHCFLIFAFILLAFRIGKEWLVATTVLSWILANLFVLKQIDLFGMSVTASDAFSVGGALGITLVSEFYGKKSAQRVVWLGFYLLLIFAVMSWIQTSYTPNVEDVHHFHYKTLLNVIPRLVAASLVAYLGSSSLNVLLSSYLQRVWVHKYLFIRVFFVIGFTQFLDTVLFTYLGLYGILSSLFSIVLFSFVVKCVATFLSLPFVLFLAKKKIVYE